MKKLRGEEQESDDEVKTPKKMKKTKAAKLINGTRGYESEHEISHDSTTTSSSLVPQFGNQKGIETPK